MLSAVVETPETQAGGCRSVTKRSIAIFALLSTLLTSCGCLTVKNTDNDVFDDPKPATCARWAVAKIDNRYRYGTATAYACLHCRPERWTLCMSCRTARPSTDILGFRAIGDVVDEGYNLWTNWNAMDRCLLPTADSLVSIFTSFG